MATPKTPKKDEVPKSSFTGLAEMLGKQMNKEFKDRPFDIVTNSGLDSVANVTQWVSTGCDMLNLAISNIPHGGYPCGRISLLYGKEQCGKSLLGGHALASTQKLGGLAVYIDTEYAFNEDFFNAIGVNTDETTDQWIFIRNNSLESILTSIDRLIGYARSMDKNRLITIVLDSFIATHTDDEIKGDFGKQGYNTSKSIIIANGLARLVGLIAEQNICMIITNQVRQKLNAQPFEDPFRMPGGQALPHYASVMIKLDATTNKTLEVHGMNRIIGRGTKAKVTKNRMGPPLITVQFDIYFASGIDNYGSWIEYMKVFKIGKISGSSYSYTLDGEEYKAVGKSAFSAILAKNEKLRTVIWKEICDKFIMVYKTDSDLVINVDEVLDTAISIEDEV